MPDLTGYENSVIVTSLPQHNIQLHSIINLGPKSMIIIWAQFAYIWHKYSIIKTETNPLASDIKMTCIIVNRTQDSLWRYISGI